ncbi:unnamed protein product [Allacma fusca]|uniref:Serine/threonine-protein kinase greatwall n=1 Tax=Allacma fusca TaxID=39272 RepID=A0A8J2JYH9_9HEXA|nr:unnamed protein product [Allacma fusca]
MDLSNFFLEGVIRGGSFGQVLLVQNARTKKQFALKEQPFALEAMDRLQLELQVHIRGDPNFILKALAAWDHKGFCYMLFELTLGDITMLNTPNELQVVSLVHQLGTALTYLHGCGYIHRKLQLSCVLIDKKYNIKLSDFGHCVKTTDVSDGIVGSPSFMAPESVLEEIYSEESDWFAFGLVIYYLLTSFELFSFASVDLAKQHWENPGTVIDFFKVFSPIWQTYLAKFVVKDISSRQSYDSSLVDLAEHHPMLLNSGCNIQRLGNLYIRAARLGHCTRKKMTVKYDHPDLYKFDDVNYQAILHERENAINVPSGMFPLYIPPQ